ncbi:uncharacterized protein K441DRAFT_661731 [Cenococcum geophilum 1.58]|uniref:uncharacterized protein n=1 Tax=Cenococcum geophilum 1.58 TaxID=794803 RepID=UPI00358E1D78|nr:hypothetical protein K441DRAFT_661731 [Cenococcum geophilum 1.58]
MVCQRASTTLAENEEKIKRDEKHELEKRQLERRRIRMPILSSRSILATRINAHF